ncbi:hypothetical protein [Bradyrhizobium sp. CCGE-LA001]|nr:hypothetical protein [Bradyrhizobium sp. CCGE-LA001]
MKPLIFIAAVALLAAAPARSQALVDPSKVAPEYHHCLETMAARQ